MPVNLLGLIMTADSSEIRARTGPVVDLDYLSAISRAHERSGFDRVLVGYFSSAPDGFLVVAHAASVTDRLGFLLAHRPGFVFPTVAARKLATLDQTTRGRLAVHIITGGDDAEQRKDGDYLGKDERYRRTDEYVTILKQIWTAGGPTSFDGEFYRFEDSYAEVRCAQEPRIPIFFGGASDIAIQVAGKHADVYALFGEPLADVQAEVQRVRAAAASYGRTVEFSVSTRPILGRTEDEAWARAHRILDTVRERYADVPIPVPQAAGGQRLLAAADRGDVHDKRLWTPLAKLTGARGNSTALVGTPEQVAEALLDYHAIGVRNLLIRGYEPLEDADAYGEVVALVKAEVARRDALDAVEPTLKAS